MRHSIRVPLALILLLMFLLGAGLGIVNYLQKGAETIISIASELQTSIEQSEWLRAESSYQHLIETWRKMSRYWPMLVHHQELDRIEESLTKLEVYLHYQEDKDSQAELNNLINLIRHIPQRESLNLRNLF